MQQMRSAPGAGTVAHNGTQRRRDVHKEYAHEPRATLQVTEYGKRRFGSNTKHQSTNDAALVGVHGDHAVTNTGVPLSKQTAPPPRTTVGP